MISPRIAFHDLDPTAWRHLARVLQPPRRAGATRRPRGAPLVLFLDGGRLASALRLGGPPVADGEIEWSGAWSLGRARRAAGAPVAVALEAGAIERVMARFDGAARVDHDLVEQGLELARAAKSELGKGILVDPDPFGALPVPPFAALQRTLDALLPDGRAGVFMLFERPQGAPWTSCIVEKQGGDIVRVTTHAALGVPRPDFRGGAHREILAAVEARIARPHVGVFLSLDAWREILDGPAGALARQVALGEAVLDPAPPWLLAMTGAGAFAGMAQGAGRLLGRFVPQTIKDTAKAMNPFASLGFDPIALVGELRKLFG